MKYLTIAWLAFFTTPALPQVQVRSIEIEHFGIYTADLKSTTRDSQGVMQSTSTNFHQSAATASIPAQIGVRFGIEFKVNGMPAGKSVTLKKVTVFPPGGLHSPAVAQTLYRNEATTDGNIGETSYTGYKFDDPWELVPGPWAIELWYGGRKLAEQKFTVTAP
jgi:hypothetical protein